MVQEEKVGALTNYICMQIQLTAAYLQFAIHNFLFSTIFCLFVFLGTLSTAICFISTFVVCVIFLQKLRLILRCKNGKNIVARKKIMFRE